MSKRKLEEENEQPSHPLLALEKLEEHENNHDAWSILHSSSSTAAFVSNSLPPCAPLAPSPPSKESEAVVQATISQHPSENKQKSNLPKETIQRLDDLATFLNRMEEDGLEVRLKVLQHLPQTELVKKLKGLERWAFLLGVEEEKVLQRGKELNILGTKSNSTPSQTDPKAVVE